MNGVSVLLAALIIPWLATGLVLLSVFRNQDVSLRVVVLGAAYLISMLVTAGMLALSSSLTGKFQFQFVFWVWGIVLVVGIILARPWKVNVPERLSRVGAGLVTSRWQMLLFSLLLLLVIVRLAGLAVENTHQPMVAWDAWLVWAERAKVWFYSQHMVPFVVSGQWLHSPDPTFYTINAWNYPKAVSLIHLWAALALGRWDEALVNLPWLFTVIALGMVIYGFLRTTGVASWLAMAGVWLLLSLPMVDAHVAMAGYGDLWLALAFSIGILGIITWHRNRSHLMLGLGLAALASMPLIKTDPSFLLLPIASLAILWVLPFRLRVVLPLLALSLLAAALVLTHGHLSLGGVGALTITKAGISLPHLGLVKPDLPALAPIMAQFMFGQDSWHMLWGAMVIAFVVLLLRDWRDTMVQALLLTLVAAIVIYAFAYASPHLLGVISNGTVVNRGLIYLAPLAIYAVIQSLCSLQQGRIVSDRVVHRTVAT